MCKSRSAHSKLLRISSLSGFRPIKIESANFACEQSNLHLTILALLNVYAHYILLLISLQLWDEKKQYPLFLPARRCTAFFLILSLYFYHFIILKSNFYSSTKVVS